MDTQKAISDIFGIFHDGGVEDFKGDSNKIVLKINCLYLAERIHEDFELFYLELETVEKLEMECWTSTEEDNVILTSWEDIFAGDIEISSSKVEDNEVIVYMYQRDPQLNYVVGELHVKAKKAKVFQHDMQEVNFKFLDKIRNSYWDSFGKA
ncbi:hypothetical protein DVK85_07090 [Flavobacterium arcticum]|uniref:Uncharacterized protein n=1 Tax=Flavobacterium arcticum TaxID=1784713 RepID=A0A345HBR1_9FLAO|nr:hypothetical protein [Flavobacterium arcticum]AXG74021.1 hypothetical protein DVK85_07090 [Flavobacterium arcticum]KAF2508999.1 hypothetical protein E0W72_10575 [Flavobacterium arcticum]